MWHCGMLVFTECGLLCYTYICMQKSSTQLANSWTWLYISTPFFSVRKQGYYTRQGTGANLQSISSADTFRTRTGSRPSCSCLSAELCVDRSVTAELDSTANSGENPNSSKSSEENESRDTWGVRLAAASCWFRWRSMNWITRQNYFTCAGCFMISFCLASVITEIFTGFDFFFRNTDEILVRGLQ